MTSQQAVTTQEQQNVDSQVLTLKYIEEHNYRFSIPSYQRPYVWLDDDALKLIQDINEARRAGESNYFIGTVLTSIRTDPEGNSVYELIDGQQRTTTLMLIALAFKKVGIPSSLSEVSTFNKQPRLQFAIRDQVQQLMGSLAGLDDHIYPGSVAVSENPYLTRVDATLTVLTQWVDALPKEERLPLADYIFEKVQWVNNKVPVEMDLNRLFATMNTAGVQLEQADILKSKLLKKIKTDKPLFDAIWVACEHMDNYFERNLRKVFPKAEWNEIEPVDLAEFSDRFERKQSIENTKSEGLTIAQLAEMSQIDVESEAKEESDVGAYDLDTKTVYCRSIIGFPLLLIHAYRIFMALHHETDDNGDVTRRVHKDRLLEIFDGLTKSSEDEVKLFIKTLWQVRYQFDRWVVKWVERDDSDEEQLRLTTLSRSQSGGKSWYINRTQKDFDSLSMLQCVRNFTGERSAQYWITPFIAGLIRDEIVEGEPATELLERIDNELSLTTETQKDASFKQARKKVVETVEWSKVENYLKEPNGTSFEHYWFQKLEYVLWKGEKERDISKFKKYRITSKNSVEHVHPQREEYGVVLKKELLDSFGNLVLLSPSENSSYSNQNVKKKMVDFEKKEQYDSLKLKAIYVLSDKGENWGSRDQKASGRHAEGFI